MEDVGDEIDQFPSAGVFLKHNDQLVSWIVYNPPFGMGRCFTLEDYRRKGYGKLVAQYMSKRLAQAGFTPEAHTLYDNAASIALFQSLGFAMRPYDLIC